MRARKLLNTAMAIAPVVLMAGIGIHARTYEDSFEWPNATGDHSRINAYVELVRETVPYVKIDRMDDEQQVREIAKAWIRDSRSGRIEPLPPVAADELYFSGLKGRILDANLMLSRKLTVYADRHIEGGKYREAAMNLVLSSDALQALKYSNFVSLMRLSLVQSTILRRFKTVYPALEEKDRAQVAACMDRMKVDRLAFELIAARAKQVIAAEIKRHRDTDKALQLASSAVPENSFYGQPALAKARPGEDGPNYTETDELVASSETAEAYHCLVVDQRNRLKIAEILSLSSR